MITIKDIAHAAGVSTSAVSLVLNNRSRGRVSSHTAQHIRAIADHFGYSPNPLAQSLRTNRTKTIGLLSNHVITLPFPSELLAGAQEAAFDNDFLMLCVDTNGCQAKEKIAINALIQRNIDALIIALPSLDTIEIPELPSDLPVVVLNGRPNSASKNSTDSVVPDNHEGAKVATQALVDAGHRNIAYCSVSGYEATEERMEGYAEALRQAHIPVDPSLIVTAQSVDTAAALGIARDLLSKPNRPTAVCCFCDQVSMAFYEVAVTLGLSIPQDLSIVGFDNQRFVAEALNPGLTTIELPLKQMGRWATQRLIERVSQPKKEFAPIHMQMKCPLIHRTSIGPPH